MLRKIFFILVIAALVFPQTFVQAQNPAIVINVDVNLNRRSINPLIYGVAFADRAAMSDLNVPTNRQGGNTTTRYNWQLNADNRASDWYFESLAYSSSAPGEFGDTFIANAKAAGVQPMLTMPMLGWVAKVGASRGKLSSFSIAKYGAQKDSDWQWFPDAGNGVRSSGEMVTGNDPNDANVAVDSTFQQGWMQHLTARWGMADNGGLRYYLMDNEPSIWFSTHRDVHPKGPTMEEVRDKILDYAAKVKANDPGALVIAPEEWGWTGYLLSGFDQQYGSTHGWNWSQLPDRNNHGGKDYLPWLLEQLKQHDTTTGQRLVDFFSVHFYPQGGEGGNDTSTAMQLKRNRSTRSLWDPNYTDESWINDKVKLIPRLKSWVDAGYPNTRTAITEYNWGAENHINGATAQADILGIFGREGLDLANRWTTPEAATPTYKAIKMYRNYDGNKSTFGDTSVAAQVANPDNLAAFAALRNTDGALTVMVIGKPLSGATPTTIQLANFAEQGITEVWQLTAANTITRLTDIAFSDSKININIPPQSITLLVVRGGPSAVVNAPTELMGSVASRQVTLTWTDNASNETGFYIERAPASTGEYSRVGQVAANIGTYVETPPKGKYFYRVQAVNQTTGVVSAYSNRVKLKAK
ncbi:MAG: cellulase [Acidobacteria bacterium]|nr:cellulase [Acidobacteriota bacterium]